MYTHASTHAHNKHTHPPQATPHTFIQAHASTRIYEPHEPRELATILIYPNTHTHPHITANSLTNSNKYSQLLCDCKIRRIQLTNSWQVGCCDAPQRESTRTFWFDESTYSLSFQFFASQSYIFHLHANSNGLAKVLVKLCEWMCGMNRSVGM